MRLRFRSEHGMALPLALGIMLVLTIVIYAVIDFSSASSRNSSLNERRQSAKALAEAGIAHGASFLAEKGESYHTTSTDTGTRTTTIQGVTVTWRATYAAPIWTVTATANPKNPTGPGASDVSRTVEAQFEWTPTGSPALWNGLYVGNPGTRPLMSNTTSYIATNVYARGDLTITQGKYLGNSFQVWGKLTLLGGTTDSSIGASDRVSGTDGAGNCVSDYQLFKKEFPAPCNRATHRVADFRVKDGCSNSTSGPWLASTCNTTSATGGNSPAPLAGKIWLPCPTDPCSSSNVTSTGLTSPTVLPDDFVLEAPDVPPALYDLGPGQPCVTTTGSPPSFVGSGIELMTGSSYSCKNADGSAELSWDFPTKTLTAKGDIYFQNDLLLKSKYWGLVGEGEGFIYVGTSLKLEPDTGLCGVRGTTAPKCDNTDGVWDPETATNLVTFVVGQDHESAILQSSFDFQGGLNADGGGYLVQGTSNFKGPLIIEGPVEIKNSGVVDAYAPVNSPSSPSGGPLELRFIPGSWRG